MKRKVLYHPCFALPGSGVWWVVIYDGRGQWNVATRCVGKKEAQRKAREIRDRMRRNAKRKEN